MAGNRIIWALLAVTALILVYAWIDGGSSDLRMIRQPVAIAGDVT